MYSTSYISFYFLWWVISKLPCIVTNLSKIEISKSIYEALRKLEWRAVVLEEMSALKWNSTWELSNLPERKQPVGCKWIFNVKFKLDGNVDYHKARLVAKGFTQTYGIDF